MSTLAICGWLVALALLPAHIRLRRRLELVARAEHELRRPIAALCLAVESNASARRREALDAQLDRVKLGLADLQAARSGQRADPQPAVVSLERLARRAAAGWRPAVQRSGRRLEVDWRAGPTAVRADPRRLTQALGNLLSNAIEHGDGPVRVVGRRSPSGVQIEVVDSGPGFDQTAPPERRAGHGHGLTIASRAVEEAGGRLSVAGGDGGSSVALELPVAEA